MEGNVLLAGIEELNTAKEMLLELNGCRLKKEEQEKEEARLEKAVEGKEKAMNDEIAATAKRRKSEIEASYDAQIDTVRAREKKIKAKKEKQKGMKVSERIEAETAELRDKNRQLKNDGKAVMQTERVPRFCNTTLFYAWFMPRSLKEILILLLTVLAVFGALPCLIYLFLPEKKPLYLVLIYLAVIVVFGGLYLVAVNRIKEKHLDALRRMRGLRNQTHLGKKQIKQVARGIRKDKDESAYGLENFDEELAEAAKELERIVKEKTGALETFERETRLIVAEEIKKNYEEELAALRQEHETAYRGQKQAEERVKELSLELSGRYESVLGKEKMTVAEIDRLISYIQEGRAANISEALRCGAAPETPAP